MTLGPKTNISKEIDEMKYRQKDESFDEKIKRISRTLSDDDEHRYKLEDILGNMRFLPAGRVQAAIGSNRITTAYNCFVSGVIEDNMNSIMEKASEAAETMRRGGGIGYDFSRWPLIRQIIQIKIGWFGRFFVCPLETLHNVQVKLDYTHTFSTMAKT